MSSARTDDGEILKLADRFAAGDLSTAVVAQVASRFGEAWRRMEQDPTSGSSRALRSAIQLVLGVGPRAHLLDRLQRRDQAAIQAFKLMTAGGLGVTWVDLATHWGRFVACQWVRWQDNDSPPADATPFSQALFWATRFNNGDSLGARSLQKLRPAKSAGLEISPSPLDSAFHPD